MFAPGIGSFDHTSREVHTVHTHGYNSTGTTVVVRWQTSLSDVLPTLWRMSSFEKDLWFKGEGVPNKRATATACQTM